MMDSSTSRTSASVQPAGSGRRRSRSRRPRRSSPSAAPRHRTSSYNPNASSSSSKILIGSGPLFDAPKEPGGGAALAGPAGFRRRRPGCSCRHPHGHIPIPVPASCGGGRRGCDGRRRLSATLFAVKSDLYQPVLAPIGVADNGLQQIATDSVTGGHKRTQRERRDTKSPANHQEATGGGMFPRLSHDGTTGSDSQFVSTLRVRAL